jgi:16S rRNA (cytidine1402-2'-O)-methyltransferase
MNMSPSTSAASNLLHTAAQTAGGQSYPAATLYVVATPIGNLADFSLRAVHVLALADAVACEDTRVGAGLLRHLGLDKPLIALHEHNERSAAGRVLERLAAGERVAYVSDAGTPAVSDPGAVLVALVREAGHRVLPIPGASSVVTALSVAGHEAGPVGFHFAGFLPAKGAERSTALDQALAQPTACVLFEAPHRVPALFDALAERAPARRVTVCRELTKQFEQVETLLADRLPGWLVADPMRHKGEFVIVLHAAPAAVANGADESGLDAASRRVLGILLPELPLKQAVALAAEISGAPRNALYAQALRLKEAGGDKAP